MPLVSASDWDLYLSAFPDSHLLQTREWGELKSAFGWDVSYLISPVSETKCTESIGAMVLIRRLPFGLTIAYIPKGPIGFNGTEDGLLAWQQFWHEVGLLCHKRKSIYIKVEPDILESSEERGASVALSNISPDSNSLFQLPEFQASSHSIQPPRTLLVDINGDEPELLARMKQKTRYNINLAKKKGVEVYPSSDLDAFYRMMLITGKRDKIGVHSYEYYRLAYQLFEPRGECTLLIAAYQGEPIAAVMVFSRGQRAWYFYGASANEHRERMPSYLLQWEAMCWARSRGCITYDLWGVPDLDEITLEANFSKKSDGLWGVYRFKRGFGGRLWRAKGPWDRVYIPPIYSFYKFWVSRRLND